MHKAVKTLIKWARANGLDVQRTRKGHHKVSTPAGPVFYPSTPSDHRSILNCHAELRRKLRASGWTDARIKGMPRR